MNSFTVLGSGFGLYGYLPALVLCGQRLLLPERYRSRFYAREELTAFASQVRWEKDENMVLEHSQGVVLALQPALQYEWLTRCLTHPNIKYLILEKPLAPTPTIASLLFEQLLHSGKVFRIGYIFRFTHWGQKLLASLKSKEEMGPLSIQWHFMAHHFYQNKTTWKRSHAEGGGVIRFYGIHVIALLAELGYQHVSMSQTESVFKEESEQWKAVFTGEHLPNCEVTIHCRSSTHQFRIAQNSPSSKEKTGLIWVDLCDPFDKDIQIHPKKTLDVRVPLLSQLCHSLWQSNTKEYEWYARTIRLWHAVENKNLLIH